MADVVSSIHATKMLRRLFQVDGEEKGGFLASAQQKENQKMLLQEDDLPSCLCSFEICRIYGGVDFCGRDIGKRKFKRSVYWEQLLVRENNPLRESLRKFCYLFSSSLNFYQFACSCEYAGRTCQRVGYTGKWKTFVVFACLSRSTAVLKSQFNSGVFYLCYLFNTLRP